MAYCHGPQSPYGCGHRLEHIEAARKGWLTRRRHTDGTYSESQESHRLASLFLGEDITYAHTDPEHPNAVMFRSKGKWYELPQKQFQAFVRGGRDLERDEERAARSERKAERMRAAEELAFQKMQDLERADVARTLKQGGGVTYKVDRGTGRKRDYGEWLRLPAQVRNKGKGRYTLDTAASEIDAQFPWLGIETGSDLIDYFDKNERRMRAASAYRERVREVQRQESEARERAKTRKHQEQEEREQTRARRQKLQQEVRERKAATSRQRAPRRTASPATSEIRPSRQPATSRQSTTPRQPRTRQGARGERKAS